MAERTPHPKELPPVSQEARERALEALSLMRRQQASLTHAASRAGTTPRTVKKYAGSALKQRPSGTYMAKAWDRIVRPMRFLTRDGIIELDVKDSRSASRIGHYMNAVDHFLETGDAGPLRAFRGKSVTVDRVARPFITDPAALRRLAAAGEVRFEEIYPML